MSISIDFSRQILISEVCSQPSATYNCEHNCKATYTNGKQRYCVLNAQNIRSIITEHGVGQFTVVDRIGKCLIQQNSDNWMNEHFKGTHSIYASKEAVNLDIAKYGAKR